MAVYTYGAVTDRGDHRSENQDCILCRIGRAGTAGAALFMVADGMGGLSWGAQVSRCIADRFARWWEEDFPDMLKIRKMDSADIRELLEQEIWDINQEILSFRKKAHCRCGSTLSLLLMHRGKYYIENIGDSRVYLLRHRKMKQLTEDQSLAAQLVREGKMTKEEAERSRQKNVLTMCLGMFDRPQSHFVSGRLKRGDIFLLCSDGLYNPLKKEQMETALMRREISIQNRVDLLRSLILPGESRDNVSAIAAEIL